MGAGARMLSGEIPTKCVQDDNRIMFHRELMETCADLMSRYTYGNSAPYAQQSDIVRYLLKVPPHCTHLDVIIYDKKKKENGRTVHWPHSRFHSFSSVYGWDNLSSLFLLGV